MPLPDPAKVVEYGTKGVELVLRTAGQAPEQRAARQLRRSLGDLGPPTGRRVLVLTPRDWAAHVQYEAVIGHGLRLRGADVRFVTCGGRLEVCDRANIYEAPPMPCTTCSNYVTRSLDAHGFPLDQLAHHWRDEDGRWPELDEVPVSELDDVELDGLPLGRLVSIPLRWFLCAAAIEDDPLGGQIGRAFLRSARRIAAALGRILDETRPDTVLLLNGLFLFESIAWELCRQRGIDVVTYERAFRKETLVFSRDVPAGFYDLSDRWRTEDRPLTPDEADELDDYLARRRVGQAFDQFWTFDEMALPQVDDGRLVSLFTNLTWDTAVIGRDVAFPDIRDWLTAAVGAFAARPRHRLVVRVHPSERALPGKETRDSLAAFVAQRFPSLPANVTVVAPDDLSSSYPLMDASDLGLVYTSTTGLELALAGTPVMVAGETHYRGKGFTIDVSSPTEFERRLDEVLADPDVFRPDVDAARRYAHFFFFRAPVRAPFVVEPLPGLARLTTTDGRALRPGAQADLDAICDLLLSGPARTAATPTTP
jgi:hypothetical protein